MLTREKLRDACWFSLNFEKLKTLTTLLKKLIKLNHVPDLAVQLTAFISELRADVRFDPSFLEDIRETRLLEMPGGFVTSSA
jgi:hypothetical protein